MSQSNKTITGLTPEHELLAGALLWAYSLRGDFVNTDKQLKNILDLGAYRKNYGFIKKHIPAVKEKIGAYGNISIDSEICEQPMTQREKLQMAIEKIKANPKNEKIKIEFSVAEILFINFKLDGFKESQSVRTLKNHSTDIEKIKSPPYNFKGKNKREDSDKISIYKENYIFKILSTFSHKYSGTIVYSFMSDMGKTSIIDYSLNSVHNNNHSLAKPFKGIFLYDHYTYGKFDTEGVSRTRKPRKVDGFREKFNEFFNTNFIDDKELKNEFIKTRYLIAITGLKDEYFDSELQNFFLSLANDENCESHFIFSTNEPNIISSNKNLAMVEITGLQNNEIKQLFINQKKDISIIPEFDKVVDYIKKQTDGNEKLIKIIINKYAYEPIRGNKNNSLQGLIEKTIKEQIGMLEKCFNDKLTIIQKNPSLYISIIYELHESNPKGIHIDFLVKMLKEDKSKIEEVLRELKANGLVKNKAENVYKTSHLLFSYMYLGNKNYFNDLDKRELKAKRINQLINIVEEIDYCYNKTIKLKILDQEWLLSTIEYHIEELYNQWLELKGDNTSFIIDKENTNDINLVNNIYYLTYYIRYYYYVRSKNQIKFIKIRRDVVNSLPSSLQKSRRLIEVNAYLANTLIKYKGDGDEIKNALKEVKPIVNNVKYGSRYSISDDVDMRMADKVHYGEYYDYEINNYLHAKALFEVYEGEKYSINSYDYKQHLENAIKIWEDCRSLKTTESTQYQNEIESLQYQNKWIITEVLKHSKDSSKVYISLKAPEQFNTQGRYLADTYAKLGELEKARSLYDELFSHAVKYEFKRGSIFAKCGLIDLDFREEKVNELTLQNIKQYILEAESDEIKDMDSLVKLYEFEGDYYKNNNMNDNAIISYTNAIICSDKIEKQNLLKKKISNINSIH